MSFSKRMQTLCLFKKTCKFCIGMHCQTTAKLWQNLLFNNIEFVLILLQVNDFERLQRLVYFFRCAGENIFFLR